MTRELTWPGIPPLEPGDLLAAAGHAYTNNNILWKRGGRTRACRECNRIYLAKRRETVA